MFADMCHIYFPTSFICVLRLLQHDNDNRACKTSTQHLQPSKPYYFLLTSPLDPSLLSADVGPTWSLCSGLAVPDCEFQAQEGHHIVGLSIRDGKPTGIIEAPTEALVCCKKMFGEPRGQHMCPK